MNTRDNSPQTSGASELYNILDELRTNIIADQVISERLLDVSEIEVDRSALSMRNKSRTSELNRLRANVDSTYDEWSE